MSPSGYESDETASEFSAQLRNWVRPRQLGRVTGAGAGFILPNSDTACYQALKQDCEHFCQVLET